MDAAALVELPDDVLIVVLGCLDFGCAYRAARTCTRMYALLLDRVAPEVARGWQHVPALLPAETQLERLAFLYAQRRSVRMAHAEAKLRNRLLVAETDEPRPPPPPSDGVRCWRSYAAVRRGELWAWSLGALPMRVAAPEPVAQVALGVAHMLVVTRSGAAYGAGSNASAQLGLAHAGPYAILTRLPATTSRRVIKAAAGGIYSVLLFSTGQAVGCGQTCSGELGLDINCIHRSLVPVFEGLQPILDVEAHDLSTAVITRRGQLYVCGYNRVGWKHKYVPMHVNFPERIVSCSLTSSLGVAFATASGGTHYAKDNAFFSEPPRWAWLPPE